MKETNGPYLLWSFLTEKKGNLYKDDQLSSQNSFCLLPSPMPALGVETQRERKMVPIQKSLLKMTPCPQPSETIECCLFD